MTRSQECAGKLSMVRGLLKERGQKGVLIREQPNFSWITAGGRGFLGLASTRACAMILVTQDSAYLLANAIEGGRICGEELPAGVFSQKTLPWELDGGLNALAEELTGGSVVCDDALNDWFALARTKLCENEKERFRILSRDTAEAVEGVLKQLHPGVPELQAAGLLSCAMWERGIEPISLFVGADDRSVRVRHFIPTDKKASEKLIASVCARRNGLVVSLTRTVYFRPVTDREKQAYMGLLQVEADTFNSIAAGTNLGDVFLKIRMAYRRAGMDQEWEKHHQGGLTGYLPREIRIDSGTKREIRQEEAYAFNLTCPGAKVEETVLLTGEGLEIMTGCVDWPTVKFEGRNRPDLLVL